MSVAPRKIVQAYLTSPTEGVVELTKDWRARHAPPLGLNGRPLRELHRVADYRFGCESGYFVNRKEEIFFFVPRGTGDGETSAPRAESGGAAIAAPKAESQIYLAGDFNGWGEAAGREEWALRPASLDGQAVWWWVGAASRFMAQPSMRFKFVRGDGRWVDVPASAPNAVRDDGGNFNRAIEPERTGQHLYQFVLPEPIDLSRR